MSKFIDRLNQVSRVAPQTMGFRAGASLFAKPKMLLVASLVGADVAQLAKRVAGADAGLIAIAKASLAAKTFTKITQAAPKIIWGGWLKDIAVKDVAPVAKAGADFIVFPAATTPISIAQNKGLGKVLEVEASLGEGLLRAAGELPVDAVLINGSQKDSLTWHNLMLFQRFAELLAKPMLVSVPAEVTAGEFQSLWEVGVDAVVVEVGAGQAMDRVKNLRGIIDKLTFPPQRKRKKTEALLPRVVPAAEAAAEEEEEEDEESDRLD
ncbi:MAG: hypothetical protein JSW30_04690 [Dehalococcoidia bacterium]|nr:MAG: hypothetical protein JSW30_04690 [Dehalococcoidia bacterium]